MMLDAEAMLALADDRLGRSEIPSPRHSWDRDTGRRRCQATGEAAAGDWGKVFR